MSSEAGPWKGQAQVGLHRGPSTSSCTDRNVHDALGLAEVYLDTVRYTRSHYRRQLRSRLAIHWPYECHDREGGPDRVGQARNREGGKHYRSRIHVLLRFLETSADGNVGKGALEPAFPFFRPPFRPQGTAGTAPGTTVRNEQIQASSRNCTRRWSDARSGRVLLFARG